MDNEKIFTLVTGLYRNQITLSPQLIEICGTITEAMMLSKILQFDEFSDEWATFDELEGKWFYFTGENWKKYGLTKNIRISAQKKLVEKELLLVIRKGNPAKNYYQINKNRFLELLEQVNRPDIMKSENQTSRSLKTRHHEVWKSDISLYRKKKTIKEKEKGSTSTTLQKLNKTGDYKPQKKKLVELLGEREGERVHKMLKGLDLRARKEYLTQVFESQENLKARKIPDKGDVESFEDIKKNRLTAEQLTILDGALEVLADYYRERLGLKSLQIPEKTKVDLASRMLEGYKFSDLLRYVKGINRAFDAATDEKQRAWYNVPLKHIFSAGNVEARITDSQIMN